MKVLRLFFFSGVLLAFSSTLADPASDARKRMMERTGGGSQIISPSSGKTEVIKTYITYVSPLREWTSGDGRTMHGRLVAFSAPEPGKQGPVVVIQEGKILLNRSDTKKPVEFPLASLSEDDQDYVRGVADAAKEIGVPDGSKEPE